MYEALNRRSEPLIELAGAVPISQAGWSGLTGWYVLACRSGREVEVSDRVSDLGLQVFAPVERFMRVTGRGGRCRKVAENRPVFPGYFFAATAMDAGQWRALRDVDGVMDILASSPGAIPSPLRHGVVEALIAAQASGCFDIKADPKYRVGDAVRIVAGPFDGLVAHITSLDKKDRLSVLLDIMGSAVPVRLKIAGVEKAV